MGPCGLGFESGYPFHKGIPGIQTTGPQTTSLQLAESGKKSFKQKTLHFAKRLIGDGLVSITHQVFLARKKTLFMFSKYRFPISIMAKNIPVEHVQVTYIYIYMHMSGQFLATFPAE